jgi:alpha-galactosidase
MILCSPILSLPVQSRFLALSSARLWCIATLALATSGLSTETRVESLDLRETLHSDWTIPKTGLAAGGGPLRVGGRTFPNGFGTVGGSRLEIVLDGSAEKFSALTGADETSGALTTVRCLVVGDDRVLYRGPWQQRGGPAVALEVPLAGVHRLALVMDARGDPFARADWLNPVITHAGAAPTAAAPVPDTSLQLAPPAEPAPRFNTPARAGVRPGRPFLQRVNVSGERPLQLTAEGLPAGFTFDAEHQVIHGTAPLAPGTVTVRLLAENARGRSSHTLEIVVGDTLALTPPMGWSSWYCMSGKVSDAWLRDAATALLATGLADYGWNYVNLDDFWMTRPASDSAIIAQLRERETVTGRLAGYYKVRIDDPTLAGPARDAQGRILANARFPDMPALTAWLHARGFKAGLYSSPGVVTCGGCTGSFGHEAEDAAQFAAWGFDFLKYDWCSFYLEAGGLERVDWLRPYLQMGDALRAQPRDIVFSLCQYGLAAVETWGVEAGGQLWRTGNDLKDTWGSISAAGFFGEERDADVGPGRWNDLDMLMLGQIGMNRQLHPVHLTRAEQRTHFALWCLRGSPLLLGGDPTVLDRDTLALLTNAGAIAVNQDPLGRPARRVVLSETLEAWIRPLTGGVVAVGLSNRDEAAAIVNLEWSQLALPGRWRSHDLWRGLTAESPATGWQGSLARHDTAFLRLEPVSP